MKNRDIELRNPHRWQHRQRGIVLPVVLVMLLVLTIASLVIVQQISSQTRMANNAGVNQISLQAAEAMLRNAASMLDNGSINSGISFYKTGTTPNSSGLYLYNAANYSSTGTKPLWTNSAVWTASPLNATYVTCASTIVKDCRVIVEMLPAVSPPGGGTLNVYRITALVIGPGGQGQVMLQTLFQKPQ